MIKKIFAQLDKLTDIPLLAMRLVLAYGFYVTVQPKIEDIDNTIGWFEKLGIPMPALNAYMATATEVAGVILLTFGLFTRYITVPLIITMIVAIATVHWGNGFEGGSNNGFEIPLYYIIMLFTLLINGSGKISVDHFLANRKS